MDTSTFSAINPTAGRRASRRASRGGGNQGQGRRFRAGRDRVAQGGSSLCGSCSEVCPVKIDISGQIDKWRRVIASEGLLPEVKSIGMKVLGATLARPAAFRAAEAIGLAAIQHLPKALLDNPLNPWTKHREMPAPTARTFRRWYAENRGEP